MEENAGYGCLTTIYFLNRALGASVNGGSFAVLRNLRDSTYTKYAFVPQIAHPDKISRFCQAVQHFHPCLDFVVIASRFANRRGNRKHCFLFERFNWCF